MKLLLYLVLVLGSSSLLSLDFEGDWCSRPHYFGSQFSPEYMFVLSSEAIRFVSIDDSYAEYAVRKLKQGSDYVLYQTISPPEFVASYFLLKEKLIEGNFESRRFRRQIALYALDDAEVEVSTSGAAFVAPYNGQCVKG